MAHEQPQNLQSEDLSKQLAVMHLTFDIGN